MSDYSIWNTLDSYKANLHCWRVSWFKWSFVGITTWVSGHDILFCQNDGHHLDLSMGFYQFCEAVVFVLVSKAH